MQRIARIEALLFPKEEMTRRPVDNGERTPRRRDAQLPFEPLPSFTASPIAKPGDNKSLSLLPSMRLNSTCLSEIDTTLPPEVKEEGEGEKTAKKRRLLIQDATDTSGDDDDVECLFS